MTVRAVGSSHGISHECRAMRCETKSQTHHRILHMKTIIDQLDSDAWILNSSRNWTRLAMMQAIHRIEHVRHNARARVETLASGRIIGIAMSYRRNHSGRREAANRINAVRQFGGDGDLTQTAVCRRASCDPREPNVCPARHHRRNCPTNRAHECQHNRESSCDLQRRLRNRPNRSWHCRNQPN